MAAAPHLDEYQMLPVQCDEIDFAAPAAEVAAQDDQSVVARKAQCPPFKEVTQLFQDHALPAKGASLASVAGLCRHQM